MSGIHIVFVPNSHHGPKQSTGELERLRRHRHRHGSHGFHKFHRPLGNLSDAENRIW